MFERGISRRGEHEGEFSDGGWRREGLGATGKNGGERIGSERENNVFFNHLNMYFNN